MNSYKRTALLIIDVQNDFCEGGSLEVKGAKDIIPKINELREQSVFNLVIYSKDWHPQDHCSFQSNHPGTELFETITLEDTQVKQVMWPDHCVQGTRGAEFHRNLVVKDSDEVVLKGTRQDTDSYSAFGNYPEQTNLEKILKDDNIERVVVVGLAYDYCVGSTALDALKLGYETYLLSDCTRSVDAEKEKEMEKKLKEANGKIETVEGFYKRILMNDDLEAKNERTKAQLKKRKMIN